MTDSSNARIILGIDPGTVLTGYALIQESHGVFSPLDFGLIRPPAKESLSTRYLVLSQSIKRLIEQFAPKELAIETPFVGKNPQSALKLGAALCCALLAAKEVGMDVFGYPPSLVKKGITGHGGATKEDVESILKARFSLVLDTQRLDATDALSIALYHAMQPTCEGLRNKNML